MLCPVLQTLRYGDTSITVLQYLPTNLWASLASPSPTQFTIVNNPIHHTARKAQCRSTVSFSPPSSILSSPSRLDASQPTIELIGLGGANPKRRPRHCWDLFLAIHVTPWTSHPATPEHPVATPQTRHPCSSLCSSQQWQWQQRQHQHPASLVAFWPLGSSTFNPAPLSRRPRRDQKAQLEPRLSIAIASQRPRHASCTLYGSPELVD